MKKIAVCVTAFLIVVSAFWGTSTEICTMLKQATVNKTIVSSTETKVDTKNTTKTVVIKEKTEDKATPETVSVTEEKYVATTKPVSTIQDTKSNCTSNFSGGGKTGPNGFFTYKGTNKITCQCQMTTDNGKTFVYSKKIIQEFNYEPTKSETDCGSYCEKVCQEFQNTLK